MIVTLLLLFTHGPVIPVVAHTVECPPGELVFFVLFSDDSNHNVAVSYRKYLHVKVVFSLPRQDTVSQQLISGTI